MPVWVRQKVKEGKELSRAAPSHEATIGDCSGGGGGGSVGGGNTTAKAK